MAQSALSAAKLSGLHPSVVFPPRPSANPDQLASARNAGTVSPLYTGSPAPMGLADFGLRSGPGGTVVGSVLNTTSLRADVDMNSTGVSALDLFQSSPDSYGIQLNAVVTNVTLFGTHGYEFWTQNVVTYYPSAHFMVLVTNVWNFSGGGLSANAFYAHGPHGTQVGTTFYFAQLFISTPITYPFNLTLFLNSTITSGRDAVDFSVVLAGPGEHFAEPYDFVVFNSLRHLEPPLTKPSPYTADGLKYNPIGLTNDFELIFGGPGGGSQATLFNADATLGLAFWTGSAYAAVPSAYGYGGETGETVTGANVAWSAAPGGPEGLPRYATMTTGPSFLRGLWNATAPAGSFPLTIAATPANAFDLLTLFGGSANFTVNETAVAPGAFTHTFWLTPGNYSVLTELSDYLPATNLVHLTGPVTLTVTLTASPAAGIYTPLWAFTNGEIAALASGGSGTPASPYLLVNNQAAPISSAFGLYNDFTFPVYPAVLFLGTTASAEFLHPANLSTATNLFQFPGSTLPPVNDLQYWFWNVSNVSIVGAANISGWFGANTWFPTAFDTFNVIFYASSHNLVAGNNFSTEGQGLIAFSGGTIFGPLNVGGGSNTIWGNRFVQVHNPASSSALLSFGLGLGLELAEAGDLVYNNLVKNPTTAWLMPLNLYSGTAETFIDTWNITPQAASNVHFASGFPTVPLSGSILGTPKQGGNFWWDYGNAANPYNGADNPYGVLPYEERATTLLLAIYGPSAYYDATYIYPGGDFAPLLAFTIYPVTVKEVGVPNGPVWGANVSNHTQVFSLNTSSSSSAYTIWLPNGSSFNFTPIVPAGYVYTGSIPGSFAVHGAPASFTLTYQLAKGLKLLIFKEYHLAAGTHWSVTINGTSIATDGYNATASSTTTSITFHVAAGMYKFRVNSVANYSAAPSSGNKTVTFSPTVVVVVFTLTRYTVTFHETGLVNATVWKVTVGTLVRYAHNPANITYHLPNGSYTFSVTPIRGYNISSPAHWSGSFVVAAAPLTIGVTFHQLKYLVTFHETGLSSGSWTVKLGTTSVTRAFSANITFNVTNRSYYYVIGEPTGMEATPDAGYVTVSGAAVVVNIHFSAGASVPALLAAPSRVALVA